jgi:hypothetical protein
MRTILLLSLVTLFLGACGKNTCEEAGGMCVGPSLGLASRLPANYEIETSTLSGTPVVADNDTDLYNQIDGAAPKYIDRGWVRGVYATYQQGTTTIQVAIQDMGTADNAQAIFDFDLPVSRVQIGGLPNAVVDMGLPNAYAAIAWAGQYYIEVSIDDRSDAALDSVQRFVVAIVGRCE